MKIISPELIAPAGDLEKLKIAFLYGADSVYASTPKYSMRTREIGFDEKSLREGIEYAHKLKKRVYLTINLFPHPLEIEALKKHVQKSISFGPDALIVADPGVVSYIRSISDIPVHLSTQANTTNQLSAEFWRQSGVSRIVLARELSLREIGAITKSTKVEIETFVHGAMCMAYSGRCQISNYLTGRDPNHGACIQACRFKYRAYALEEDMRKGEYFPIEEDERGTYLLNSKDLCMIECIPELIKAGIGSFKIEGRAKGIYYLAAVVRAYRQAIDLAVKNPAEYKKAKPSLKQELEKTSSRSFTTGFYFDKPGQNTNNYETARTASEWDFVGLSKDYDVQAKRLIFEARNKLTDGDSIEIMTPNEIYKTKIKDLRKSDEPAEAVHAGTIASFKFNTSVPENSFIRTK